MHRTEPAGTGEHPCRAVASSDAWAASFLNEWRDNGRLARHILHMDNRPMVRAESEALKRRCKRDVPQQDDPQNVLLWDVKPNSEHYS